MPVDESLRKWITDNYNAGFTPEQLRTTLAESGQDPAAVDEVLKASPQTPLLPPPPAPKKKGINWTIVVVIFILGLLVGVLFFFNTVISNLITASAGVAGIRT
ncbi:MAG: hypothetical protein HY366_02375 [Candidatus Aenigmarchaeota archaeon]|nr:hypothetical protein [Candidatus Aenigmarchaeota archaeon]